MCASHPNELYFGFYLFRAVLLLHGSQWPVFITATKVAFEVVFQIRIASPNVRVKTAFRALDVEMMPDYSYINLQSLWAY